MKKQVKKPTDSHKKTQVSRKASLKLMQCNSNLKCILTCTSPILDVLRLHRYRHHHDFLRFLGLAKVASFYIQISTHTRTHLNNDTHFLLFSKYKRMHNFKCVNAVVPFALCSRKRKVSERCKTESKTSVNGVTRKGKRGWMMARRKEHQ